MDELITTVSTMSMDEWLKLAPAIVGVGIGIFVWIYVNRQFKPKSLKRYGAILEKLNDILQLQDPKFKREEKEVTLSGQLDNYKLEVELGITFNTCFVTLEQNREFKLQFELKRDEDGDLKRKYGKSQELGTKWEQDEDEDRGFHLGDNIWIEGDGRELKRWQEAEAAIPSEHRKRLRKRMDELKVMEVDISYERIRSRIELKPLNEKTILAVIELMKDYAKLAR